MLTSRHRNRLLPLSGVALAALLLACTGNDPAGPNLRDVDGRTPSGPERLFLHRQSPLVLAPGRESWLGVAAYVQTSPSSMVPVPAEVTFQSSNPGVAAVVAADSGWARVTARAVGSATITVRSTRDPSNVRTLPVTVQAAPVGDEAGLVFSADASVRPTSGHGAHPDAPLGPMELDVRVTITNPTTEPRDLWVSGCTAWTRIYRGADRSGPPLADVPRGVECVAQPRHLTFAPGEARTFHAEGYRLDIARDTLAPGTYHVAAAVDRIRDLLEVPAGPVDVTSPNAGLEFTATTAIVGPAADGLRTSVAFRNTNAQGVRLEYGACAVALLAWRSAARSGPPVWSSTARRTPDGITYGCPAYLAIGVVRPGETASPAEFNPVFPIREVLGDSLPSGRYYFRAQVRLNWRSTVVDAGEAELRR